MSKCHFCEATARYKCSACQNVTYCSRACQRYDFGNHYSICRDAEGIGAKFPITNANIEWARSNPASVIPTATVISMLASVISITPDIGEVVAGLRFYALPHLNSEEESELMEDLKGMKVQDASMGVYKYHVIASSPKKEEFAPFVLIGREVFLYWEKDSALDIEGWVDVGAMLLEHAPHLRQILGIPLDKLIGSPVNLPPGGRPLVQHRAAASCMAFLPVRSDYELLPWKGRIAAVGYTDGTVTIWDTKSMKEKNVLVQNTVHGAVTACAFELNHEGRDPDALIAVYANGFIGRWMIYFRMHLVYFGKEYFPEPVILAEDQRRNIALVINRGPSQSLAVKEEGSRDVPILDARLGPPNSQDMLLLTFNGLFMVSMDYMTFSQGALYAERVYTYNKYRLLCFDVTSYDMEDDRVDFDLLLGGNDEILYCPNVFDNINDLTSQLRVVRQGLNNPMCVRFHPFRHDFFGFVTPDSVEIASLGDSEPPFAHGQPISSREQGSPQFCEFSADGNRMGVSFWGTTRIALYNIYFAARVLMLIATVSVPGESLSTPWLRLSPSHADIFVPSQTINGVITYKDIFGAMTIQRERRASLIKSLNESHKRGEEAEEEFLVSEMKGMRLPEKKKK